MVVAVIPQGGELCLGVEGAHFRGVRDVDHPGQHHVLAAVALDHRVHQGGGELAVGREDGADLVAGGLDGAGLVDVDVAGVGGDDGLIGGQQRVQHHRVGLGAAHQEVDVGLWAGAEGADQLGGVLAEGVQTVAAGLGEVGPGQSLQHLGMASLRIVVVKINHHLSSRTDILSYCIPSVPVCQE